MADVKMVPEKAPGTGGEKYIPIEERTGNESIVYFTRDLSAEGLKKLFDRVGGQIGGKVSTEFMALAEAGDGEEILSATCDLSVVAGIRSSINVFRDRRPALYDLSK